MARRVRGESRSRLIHGAAQAHGERADEGTTAHYEDPAYYDAAYADRRDDVAAYVRLSRYSGGPVLEYGVGTGRVALEIARSGVSVTGIDASAPMLAHFREKLAGEPAEVRRRVRLVRGDMRRTQLGQRFPLVIAPFNAVQHLYDRRDMEQFLARARAHLAPRGRLVFDVLTPHADYLGADPDRWFGAPRFRYPGQGVVRYRERFEYDTLRQVLLMRFHFRPESGAPAWEIPLTHRQWFPQELEAILHYNGFEDLVWTENFTDSPASPEADSLVVSCRAATARRRPAPRKRAPRGRP